MADLKYAMQNMKENMAKASGRDLHVSPKQAIEICNYIRGRPLKQAKMLLQQSIDLKFPIPFKKFTNGLGHKPGMSAGRFVPKACGEILQVIESAEANAKNKGFNADDLIVKHICMQRAAKSWHYGRKKRSVFKSSHIEVVLEEVKGLSEKKGSKSKKNEKSDAKSSKKETTKPAKVKK